MAIRQHRVIIYSVVAFAFCLSAYYWARTREPVYQGKKASEWVREVVMLQTNAAGNVMQVRNTQAIEAIEQLGPDAVPAILKLLRVRDVFSTEELLSPVTRLARKSNGNLPDYECHQRALVAFDVLGSRAQSAVPELVEMLRSPRKGFRADAARALQSIGPDAQDATPALIQAALDSEPLVRCCALLALYQVTNSPGLMVPVLTKALQDPSIAVRQTAINGLRKYPESAAAAVPALVKELQDPSAYARESSAELLKQIDPRAARLAGVK